MRTLRRFCGGIALAAVLAAGVIALGSPVEAQSAGACPDGLASVAAVVGKAFVPVAAGVPAGCYNPACPSDKVAVSPFADGSTPQLASAARGVSELGCAVRQGSEVAPPAAVFPTVVTTVTVLGKVETNPAPSVGGISVDAQGGIRGSVLARTGSDSSGEQLRFGGLLLAAGAALIGLSMLARRYGRAGRQLTPTP